MKHFAPIKLFLLFAVGLVCVSCDKIGGGVAGAGYDSIWVRNEAKNYQGYQDVSITLTREATNVPDVQQAFEKMLDGFPEHMLIEQNTNSIFGEFQISFHKQHLSVQRTGHLLFEERLPSAFYMHELQVGRFQIHGHDLLLFLTKSRATTGLYFVGLYETTGQRLLTKTISVGELWDCKLSPEELTFLCPSQQLHITIK
ncbi:MAG: hypothetical protein ACREFE_17285 [Limisphaerales bacterium]